MPNASALDGFEVRIPSLVLPKALFELAIGLWLLVKGLRSHKPVD